MSRPKGSKNKKTLEKESQLKNSKLNKSDKSTWKPSLTAEPKDYGTIKQELNKSKQAFITYIEENTDFVQYPNQMNKQPKDEQNYLDKLDKKQLEKLKECKKCKNKIVADPYKIDTNLIAGLVSTHREHPRYINLCRQCAKELSDMIDNWLGEDYPTKWQDNSDGY